MWLLAVSVSNLMMIASPLFLYSEALGMGTFANSTFNTVTMLLVVTAGKALWTTSRDEKGLVLLAGF